MRVRGPKNTTTLTTTIFPLAVFNDTVRCRTLRRYSIHHMKRNKRENRTQTATCVPCFKIVLREGSQAVD